METWGLAIWEHEFWTTKICAGYLGPADYVAYVFQTQILGGDLGLANFGPEVLESSGLCWRLGAWQFRAQEFWKMLDI